MVYSHAAANFLIPQKAPCTTSRLLLLCPSSLLFLPAFLYFPISGSRYHCLLFHGATISCMAPSMIIRPFIYFILRHGARGLWPKDEKERRKVENMQAGKQTNKQNFHRRLLLASPLLRITISSPVIHRLREIRENMKW
jgi:hypothetical protein